MKSGKICYIYSITNLTSTGDERPSFCKMFFFKLGSNCKNAGWLMVQQMCLNFWIHVRANYRRSVVYFMVSSQSCKKWHSISRSYVTNGSKHFPCVEGRKSKPLLAARCRWNDHSVVHRAKSHPVPTSDGGIQVQKLKHIFAKHDRGCHMWVFSGMMSSKKGFFTVLWVTVVTVGRGNSHVSRFTE